MGKLYRFELAFDGEPQGVGILNGLDDVGLTQRRYWQLMHMFNELNAPDLDKVAGAKNGVSFWFTHAGIDRFMDAIEALSCDVFSNGWEIIVREMDDSCEGEIYRDEYQVAFPLEYIQVGKYPWAFTEEWATWIQKRRRRLYKYRTCLEPRK